MGNTIALNFLSALQNGDVVKVMISMGARITKLILQEYDSAGWLHLLPPFNSSLCNDASQVLKETGECKAAYPQY